MASIFLRGKTYWILYYQDRKKITYSLKTRDKKVAAYRKNEVENKVARGDSPLVNDKILAADALEEYLSFCRPRITPTTLYHYKIYIQAYLDHSSVFSLKQVNESSLRAFLDSKNDLSKSTMHHIIRYITSFINWAVKRNYLKENPTRNIHRPKLEQTKHRFLSKEEIEKILKFSPEVNLKEYVLFALYTGMRPSELRRLNWKDINLESNTIIIQKSKTGKARAIPIHSQLKKLEFKKDGSVFNWTNMRERFYKLKELSGISDIDLYTFRHTFASQLIMAGADLVAVKNLMGHARIETTMIYSHLSDEHTRQAINKLQI